MKANTRKATDFPSLTATFIAETEGASDSERGKVVDGLLGTSHRRVAFSWKFTPCRYMHEWTDYRPRGHAVPFATLHPISTSVQWICFVATGIAFGWIRVRSGSTAASAVMHAI